MYIPELLVLIARELDAKDRRALMLVSKCHFYSVRHLAWDRVSRLDIILRLIKDVQVESRDFRRRGSYTDKRWIITLPPSLDFSRWEVYSPWVQELEIFGGYDQEVKNLQPLLTLLGGRPLLPNLRRLTIYSPFPINGNHLMDFIHMFINPSLTEIRAIIPRTGLSGDDDCRMPRSSIPEFLQQIKEICPQIRVLEFYPESTTHPSISSPDFYSPSIQCRGVLSSFSNLQSFSSTTYILEPAFLGILGDLPHLESLGIRGSLIEHPVLAKYGKSLPISEDGFPALKDLRLYDVHPKDVEALWDQPTIATKLVSILIQTDTSYLPHRNPPNKRTWVGPFLEALPSLSPHLQTVALYAGEGEFREEIPQGGHHWRRIVEDTSLKTLEFIVLQASLGLRLAS